LIEVRGDGTIRPGDREVGTFGKTVSVDDRRAKCKDAVDVAIRIFENAADDWEEGRSYSVGIARCDEFSVQGNQNNGDTTNATREREGTGWECRAAVTAVATVPAVAAVATIATITTVAAITAVAAKTA
jgi:hypothetical protein